MPKGLEASNDHDVMQTQTCATQSLYASLSCFLCLCQVRACLCCNLKFVASLVTGLFMLALLASERERGSEKRSNKV